MVIAVITLVGRALGECATFPWEGRSREGGELGLLGSC